MLLINSRCSYPRRWRNAGTGEAARGREKAVERGARGNRQFIEISFGQERIRAIQAERRRGRRETRERETMTKVSERAKKGGKRRGPASRAPRDGTSPRVLFRSEGMKELDGRDSAEGLSDENTGRRT